MVWRWCGVRRWGVVVEAWLCVMVAQYPLVVFGETTLPVAQQTLSAQSQKSVPGSTMKLVPTLGLSQRYDSNVYFVPGRDLEDYVTTMSPGLLLSHTNQWMDAYVGGGATGEVYIKNPGLNYVGGNGTVNLNLDGVMHSLISGFGLRIVNTVIYTPQPQLFASSTGGNQLSQTLVPGLQPGRVNTLWNSARVDASYSFSSFMSMSVTYTDQRVRFGGKFAAPTEAPRETLFNTGFQTLTSGFVGKPTHSDTLLLAHQYQKGTFSHSDGGGDSGGSRDSGFSTQGAIARWSRTISSELRAMVEGGFTVISPSGDVQPVAAASLQWKGQYTAAQISYSRSVASSFLAVATPLLSHVVDVQLRRQLTESLSLWLDGNYAVNQSVPDRALVRFESYSVGPSLEYKIGQNITATLSYAHIEFNEVFLGTSRDFDRDMVMVSVLTEWR